MKMLLLVLFTILFLPLLNSHASLDKMFSSDECCVELLFDVVLLLVMPIDTMRIKLIVTL